MQNAVLFPEINMPFPLPGDLPDPGIEPTSLALAGGFLTTNTNIYICNFLFVCDKISTPHFIF